MQRRILVTGATGLLGNNVARGLLEAGDAVRVLVRPTSSPRPLEGLDVERVRGDIGEPDTVRWACDGVDAVIHSAGYVQLGRSRRNLAIHRAVNVTGARNVAEAARAAGIRMVHVSTVDALGLGTPDRPADEQSLPSVDIPCNYVISKREAEDAVLQEVARGLDAVIVNPGFMLGPWDWKPSSGRMLLEVARGRGLLAPRGWYTMCDVRDVTTGILAALERGRSGQRYILGGENMTYLDAWRLFAEVTGARRPLAAAGPALLWLAGQGGDLWTLLTGREPDVNSGSIALARCCKRYSSQRAREELGYQNRPVRETVEEAWHWFQAEGIA